MLSTSTDEERKTLESNSQRIKGVSKEVEDMGGKILAQQAILSQYDFVNIMEAVGNTTIAKIALEPGGERYSPDYDHGCHIYR